MNNLNQDTSMEDFIAAMEALAPDLNDAKMKAPAPKRQFSCQHCGGTGRWSRGTNSYGNSDCRACRGKGYFVTSPEFRAKAKARLDNKKADAKRKLGADIAAFAEAQPEMFKELRDAHAYGTGNDFIRSLAERLFKYGALTENQIAAWHRGREKLIALRAEKAVSVDLSGIWAMFDTALANGYKKPVYRAEGLKISKAPMHGRNPGALYVVEVETDSYLGKVVDGKYHGKPQGEDALQVIAADPKAAAIRYGQRTGTCSCCGRQLTNHASIELGIGPICAEKWGLA